MKAFRTTMLALSAALLCAAPAHASSTAEITGSFTDACRDFSAHSTKDVSHVELRYADGRTVKDETIATPDYSLDGGAGDEIDVAVVKSGMTRDTFTCDHGGAPVARLEIRMSLYCQPYTSSTGDTYYWCRDGVPNAQRSAFVDPGGLRIDMGCLGPDPLCLTTTFRGSGSTDPDGDITSWSIAFDDGTVASGGWAATPPEEVTHEYAWDPCPSVYCRITLTVTDSQGRTDTESIQLAFYDLSPD